MIFSIDKFNLKKVISYADWKLLLFLLLFLNVKLAIKIPAVAVIYLLQFNFRFGFSFKNSRLPLFYLLIIAIAFIGLVANKSYAAPNYIMVFLMGIGFWALCLLAVHQVKLSVERNDTETIHRTIVIFFLINTFVSVLNLGLIIWETHHIIPYRYQGEFQKYFISTGDYIKGLTFDTSTTNAVLNAFGVIYFLTKKQPAMLLTCMAVLLLTGSNFINLALLLVFIFIFMFKSNRYQKSLIVVCLMFLVVFMVKISPENNDYVAGIIEKTFNIEKTLPISIALPGKRPNLNSPDEIKRTIARKYLDSESYILNQKKRAKTASDMVLYRLPKTDEGRIYVRKDDITAFDHQWSHKPTEEQKHLIAFIKTHHVVLPVSQQNDYEKKYLPGKAIALIQTATFLKNNPSKILVGDGVGNFSSKLAFRVTGLGFAGSFSSKYVYINKDFFYNHLNLYLYFFSKLAELHSLTNSPYSVYDQVISEYGLAGLAGLIVFYFGFFAKYYTVLTYGIPLLIFVAGIFFIDYWFEQLSVLIMFELMLFLNIKESQNLIPIPVNS